MATPEGTVAASLDADPMRRALNGIDVFCGDAMPPRLDGIAYTLTFQTMHLHGTLQFGNPLHECLRSLERALLEVASRIARQSGEARLLESVEAWTEFVNGKPR
jgi:hypothetical protein